MSEPALSGSRRRFSRLVRGLAFALVAVIGVPGMRLLLLLAAEAGDSTEARLGRRGSPWGIYPSDSLG